MPEETPDLTELRLLDIKSYELRLVEHYKTLTWIIGRWQSSVFAIIVVCFAGLMANPDAILQPNAQNGNGLRLWLVLVGSGLATSLATSLSLFLYTRTVYALRENAHRWQECRAAYCALPAIGADDDSELAGWLRTNTEHLWRPPWMMVMAVVLFAFAFLGGVLALLGADYPSAQSVKYVPDAVRVLVLLNGVLMLGCFLSLYYQISIKPQDR